MHRLSGFLSIEIAIAHNTRTAHNFARLIGSKKLTPLSENAQLTACLHLADRRQLAQFSRLSRHKRGGNTPLSESIKLEKLRLGVAQNLLFHLSRQRCTG